jgi:general secretion pathway protein M
MNALLNFWAERVPRERAILAGGAAALLLALVYALLIDPAWSGIGRLQRSLPSLRTQASQLEQLLAEVRSLRARAQVASVAPQEARAQIERTLAAAGLKSSRVVPLADGDLQLSFANVPYANWVVWLATAERDLGARAASVKATATATPGNVDIDVALHLARR